MSHLYSCNKEVQGFRWRRYSQEDYFKRSEDASVFKT